MAQVTVLVCDTCSTPGAVHYEITSDADTWSVDLCEKHSRCFRDPEASKSSRSRFHVTDIE